MPARDRSNPRVSAPEQRAAPEAAVDRGIAAPPGGSVSPPASQTPGEELADRGSDRLRSTEDSPSTERARAGRETRRDETARLRDVTAGSRDLAAEARDRTAEDEQEALLLSEQTRDSAIRALLSASGEVRERAAADRAGAASDRHLAAADRADASADRGRMERQRLRDATAGSRDLAADARDQTAGREALTILINETARDSTIRGLLSASGAVRDRSAADRAGSASDRQHAAADRAQASADSGEARIELAQAQLDGLTGAHRRDLGSAVLDNEIERARRSGEPFTLAFVDVDGLKRLNDRQGHAAGDALLRAVVVALRAELRSYDPIVRVGGDEFLCGFTKTKLGAARRRIAEIRAALQQGPAAASISVGLAMLGDRDTLEKLIARADADMYATKQRQREAR
jgi:diguanylate cyclase (GGDEF)-like protein